MEVAVNRVTDLSAVEAYLGPLNDETRPIVTNAYYAMNDLFDPATKDDITKVILMLDALPRKAEGEASAKIKIATYQRALAQTPKWALSRAVDEIIRSDHWYPVPARILEVAEEHMKRARWRRAVLGEWLIIPPKALPDPADNRIPMEEVDEANHLMRSLKLKTRYTPDGAAYQLADGDEDPAPAPASPEPEE